MRLRLPDRGERGERGAIAVLTALLAVLVLAMAALAVDIATQTNQRQKLHDTIDAAALAGAYSLPNSGAATVDALAFAAKNDPAAPIPVVDVLCVVGSIWNAGTGTYVVDTTQITANCTRSAGTSTTGARCNSTICSLPCSGTDSCNVIRVVDAKPVPFSFAPVIGINSGSTGSLTSAACKGSCGKIPPNPMDVAVVADRTSSMSPTDITAMITGIKSMFQVMTPSQQYVSLGTIGRSKLGASSTTCSLIGSTLKALSEPSTSDTQGPWIPVPFSNDYLSGTTTINAGSTLVNAVECLKNSSGTGTHLASAMKYAARYLLGFDPNNIGSVPLQSGTVALPTQPGTIRKAIIFETDGAPNESATGGSTTLSNPGDIENTNKNLACTDLSTLDGLAGVASNAKAAGLLVVTVAFNVDPTTKCNGSSGARLDQTLAAAASVQSPGVPSAVGTNDCSDATVGGGRYKENNDGDYFFCAGTGTDMKAIFLNAFKQLATGSRLIQLP